MRLFISWSGTRSQQFANALRSWIPEVIQQVQPFMSSEDIAKGSRWGTELFARLELNSQGIICVTDENQHQPWLNFETGALAKSIQESSVRPVLLGLRPTDVSGPLSLFQATIGESREDMLRLIESINDECADPLEVTKLHRAFDRTWDEFFQALSSIPVDTAHSPKRETSDMVSEILTLVRQQRRQEPLDSLPPFRLTTDDVHIPLIGRASAVILQEDDVVLHKEFGIGRIKAIRGDGSKRVAHVIFSGNEEKQLHLAFAPIYKLSPNADLMPITIGAPVTHQDR